MVTREVDDDTSRPSAGPLEMPDPVPVLVRASQRFLRDVVAGLAIPAQRRGERCQASVFSPEEHLERPINRSARASVLHHVRVGPGEREDSFEQFFRSMYPRLVAIGLGWSADRHAATDLAQETLARALSDWDRVAGLAAPGGWAVRVMTNLLIDDQRRRGREQRAVAAARGPVVDAPVAITDVDWREAVRSLPTRQRTAIVLYYVADMSVQEVADAMEVAPGTVKATLAHARAALMAAVAGEVIG